MTNNLDSLAEQFCKTFNSLSYPYDEVEHSVNIGDKKHKIKLEYKIIEIEFDFMELKNITGLNFIKKLRQATDSVLSSIGNPKCFVGNMNYIGYHHANKAAYSHRLVFRINNLDKLFHDAEFENKLESLLNE